MSVVKLKKFFEVGDIIEDHSGKLFMWIIGYPGSRMVGVVWLDDDHFNAIDRTYKNIFELNKVYSMWKESNHKFKVSGKTEYGVGKIYKIKGIHRYRLSVEEHNDIRLISLNSSTVLPVSFSNVKNISSDTHEVFPGELILSNKYLSW